MMMKVQYVTIVYVTSLYLLIADNVGSEFIVGFMENKESDLDVEIYITTMEPVTVNVNISAPRYTASTIFQQMTVTDGSYQHISLDGDLRMIGSSTDTKALYITADNNIVVHGVNKALYSTDAFLGLPVTVLGTEYFAVTYHPAQHQTQILIIVVQNDTSVTITLPTTTGGDLMYENYAYGPGSSISETMDRFDTFQIVNTNTNGDLTGAHITSDKPIAVYSGNKRASIGSGPSKDHLVEMLYPVDRWGKEFLTVPIPERTVGDKFRIVSSEDSTLVHITGGYSSSFMLSKAGDMREEDIPSTAYCHIVADKASAVTVVQFVLSQQSSDERADPAMIIIPSVDQFSYSHTFSTPTLSSPSTSYLLIVVKDSDKGGLKLDGSSINVNTTSISGTDYVGGYVSISEGTHTIEHTSRIVFFGAYLYGYALYESYGYPVGMRLGLINKVSTKQNNTNSKKGKS